jgi:hypothetical protein
MSAVVDEILWLVSLLMSAAVLGVGALATWVS